MHAADKKYRRKITGSVKWSPKYNKEMDLVELWVLLKTRYDKHHYNGQQLTQIKYKFPHVTPNTNEAEIKTGIWSEYSVSKVSKNQAEALSIEYCTILSDALEGAGKGQAATHIHNMQRRDEYRTLSRRVKYTKDKFRKPGTTVVTKQRTDGIQLEITDKIPLEEFIIAEKLKSDTRPKVWFGSERIL